MNYKSHKPSSDVEIASYCAMAMSLADFVRIKAPFDNASCPDFTSRVDADALIFSNDALTMFQKASKALRSLGVMKELNDRHSAIAGTSQHERERIMANWSKGPSFAELLSTFLELLGGFSPDTGWSQWGWGLETRIGHTFEPKRESLRMALVALAPLGFVEIVDGGFHWTSKAEPILSECGF